MGRDGINQKKFGKLTGKKWNDRKLDRKSSRGMIYENEELRLRTININAEVERGQSDIRKLRRENEQLRREIWSLRDEYDRLNKLLSTSKNISSCENDGNSGSQSEDSDSCDICKDDDLDGEYDKECLKKDQDSSDGSNSCSHKINSNNQEIVENYENSQKSLDTGCCSNRQISKSSEGPNEKLRDNLHVNFDHLSIVSEENLTGSDGNSVNHADIDSNTNLTMPKSPVSPLRDLQSIVPPLSHFENIAYEKIGPRLEASSASVDDLNCSTSTTTTGDTVVPASGWDFNFPSTFSNCGDKTFQNTIPSLSVTDLQNELPCNTNTTFRSPKHFFSPIKPRLYIDNVKPVNNAPDLFVSNALASPYFRPSNTSQTQSSGLPIETQFPAIQTNQSRACSPNSLQTAGNLEELLMDIESLQKQLEKHKSYSQEKLSSTTNGNLSNPKPYRSEMNLQLTYNGSNPVITPITKATSASGFAYNSKLFINNNLDTPPPNLPEPMILFPQNLTYIGLENYGQPCGPMLGSVPTLVQYPDEYSGRVPTPTVCDITSGKGFDSPASMRRKMFTKCNNDLIPPESFDSTKLMEKDTKKLSRTDATTSEITQPDSSSGSETGKRKSRRVSIIFNGKKSEEKDRDKEQEKERDRKTEENTQTNKVNTSDLGASVTNDIQSHKIELVTQSTPNSPHSGGRRNTNAYMHGGHHHHHHHHHHHNRKMSQDSVKFPRKCSRRHSEGTVLPGLGSSGGFSSVTHDSFHEPGTSISERNSNSIASSRESSTSQSTHSQRRKISVSSHNGGKIPWCGCWGNGCL